MDISLKIRIKKAKTALFNELYTTPECSTKRGFCQEFLLEKSEKMA